MQLTDIALGINLAIFASFAVFALAAARRSTVDLLSRFANLIAGLITLMLIWAVAGFAIGRARAGKLPELLATFVLDYLNLFLAVGTAAILYAAYRTFEKLMEREGQVQRLVAAVAGNKPGGDPVDLSDLTEREAEVLQAMINGRLGDDQIAEVLFISNSTAGTHVRNILRKTGTRNRRELVMLAGLQEMA